MTRFTAKTAEAARKMAAAIMPNAIPEKKNDVVATIEVGGEQSDTAIDEIRAQLGIENAAKVEVKKFEVGKWYYIHSSPNCLPDYKVIRRGKKSVTLIDEDGDIVITPTVKDAKIKRQSSLR